MDHRICQAIADRWVIRFGYSGGLRVVEPYCHGVSTTGAAMVLGVQVAGYSSSRDTKAWRMFDESKISGLRVTNEVFQPDRDDFDRGNIWKLAEVHCRV